MDTTLPNFIPIHGYIKCVLSDMLYLMVFFHSVRVPLYWIDLFQIFWKFWIFISVGDKDFPLSLINTEPYAEFGMVEKMHTELTTEYGIYYTYMFFFPGAFW